MQTNVAVLEETLPPAPTAAQEQVVLDVLPEGVFALKPDLEGDKKFVLTFANAVLADILKMKTYEAVGQPLELLFPQWQYPVLYQTLETIMDEKARRVLDMTFETMGSVRNIRMILVGGDGAVVGTVNDAEDMAARVQFMEQNAQAVLNEANVLEKARTDLEQEVARLRESSEHVEPALEPGAEVAVAPEFETGNQPDDELDAQEEFVLLETELQLQPDGEKQSLPEMELELEASAEPALEQQPELALEAPFEAEPQPEPLLQTEPLPQTNTESETEPEPDQIVREQQVQEFDDLSGMPNRAMFFERAAAEFQRSKRYRHPLSLALAKIEGYANVVKSRGPQAANEAITSFAQICQSCSRDGVDLIGRVSDEHFAILLPETEIAGALHFVERLRIRLSAMPVEHTSKMRFDISSAISEMRTDDPSFSRMMGRAQDDLNSQPE